MIQWLNHCRFLVVSTMLRGIDLFGQPKTHQRSSGTSLASISAWDVAMEMSHPIFNDGKSLYNGYCIAPTTKFWVGLSPMETMGVLDSWNCGLCQSESRWMIIRVTISNYLLFQIHFQIPSVFMFLSFILFFQTQTIPWIIDLQLLLHFLSERHSLWEKPKKVLLRTCHRISWCNFLEILIFDECEDSLVMPSSFPAKTKEFFFV